MRSATGHYSIALARNARPGNWLPLAGSDPVVLILRVVAAQAVETSGPGDLNVSALGLPVIKRIGCR
jgi:hypothetical protein